MEALGCLFVLAIIFLIIKAFIGKKDNKHIRQQQQQDDTPIHWLVESIQNVESERMRYESNSFRITDCWIPAGLECTVGAYTIPGGMIYVGKAPNNTGNNPIYPALIDPRLAINEQRPDKQGSTLSYYPSYSSISPQARAAYLEWLVKGRQDPDTPIGYVFLFFYGLERRLLVDLKDKHQHQEKDAILNEVLRLLSIYHDNWSFRNYAHDFLVYVLTKLERWNDIIDLYKDFRVRGLNEIPVSFRIGIAQYISSEQPIPAEWALEWVRLEPFSNLRTPAQRCYCELQKLFAFRYYKMYDKGVSISPNKTFIKVKYHPASQALYSRSYSRQTTFPDIGKLTQPISKFRPIVEGCIDELDAYSRYLGRHPDDRESLPAMALLPKSLLTLSDNSRLVTTKVLLQSIITDEGTGFITLKDILNIWDILTEKRIAKKDLTSIALLLEGLGFGIEPDPRFSGTSMNPEDPVIVFLWREGVPSSPGSEYAESLLRLQISAMICLADQVVSASEQQHLQQLINGFSNLTEGEKRRLGAHLKWFVKACPSRTDLFKKLEKLPENQKYLVADFLLEVARVDGNIDPEEVKLLSKLYSKMGLSEEELHTSIHQSFTRHREPTEPVTIKDADPTEESYAIPEEAQKERGVTLDLDAIQRKKKETAAVTNLLHNIFTEDEPESVPTAPIHSMNDSTIRGLSPEMSDFLRALGKKSVWSRQDIEELAQRCGLMPDGTIEDINDLAYDIADEPLLEEDEDMIINQEIYKELMRGENSED